MARSRLFTFLLLFLIESGAASAAPFDHSLDVIKLPKGFHIQVYADHVPNAREMALGKYGTVFVGSMREGKVYALLDKDQDQVAEEVLVIAEHLELPVGVAFHDGALYVSAVSRILKYDRIESRLRNPPEPEIVYDGLPSDRAHGWKFIAFGPDGKLYVPVGAPCNICESQDERYASILRMDPDGRNVEIFARGVRNTVGFDWNPETGVLWFTDNGRDWMGDDLPPDELNRAPYPGMHFGYPYCHGQNLPDPDFGKKKPCGETEPAAVALAPHTAALGMRFYTGRMFPKEYQNQIFIAEHGSWNRSTLMGYRVTMVRLDEKHEPISYETFADGWSWNGVWGRPADVLVMPDGALLVSDDYAGVIYRISYQG